MFLMLKVKPANISCGTAKGIWKQLLRYLHQHAEAPDLPQIPTGRWHKYKLLPHETLLNWNKSVFILYSSTCAAWHQCRWVTGLNGSTEAANAVTVTDLVKCGTIKHFQQEELSMHIQYFLCTETLCGQHVHFSVTMINSLILSSHKYFTGLWMGFSGPVVVKVFSTCRWAWDI